jgi:multiple sugar transport system permease protein
MRRNAERAVLYAALLVLAVPFVFPFWWMLTSSLKSANEIFAYPPRLLPEVWQWQNLVDVFTYQPFARHYFNSLYIAGVVTVGTIAVASLAGYAFARIRFPGRGILFVLLLSTLMMPTEVTIIPNFQIMQAVGLLNTHVPLILIPIFGAAGVMGTFLMRQFFLGLPRELEEAAMIDGLGRLGVFRHIALPLAGPAIASLAVITFLASWNSFLEPLVYVNDLDLFTLPLSLRNFADAYGLPVWHLQLAATSLSVVPILIVYALAQRRIVESFATSGLKG